MPTQLQFKDMQILFLAPQPFFQDRGTPIAVRLAVQVLASREGDRIDLLTYHEGSDIPIPQVRQFRIKAPRALRNIRPGISFKKLLCDAIFLVTALGMVWRQRREQYDLVHAVEESVFVAFLIKLLWGVPYIYDMDSSLAQQVTEKWQLLRPLRPFLQLCERLAVKHSHAVVPVCDALAAIADQHGSPDTQILRDISLLDLDTSHEPMQADLAAEIHASAGEEIVLYIGNLEPYQGIDLLLESFACAAPLHPRAHLAIIGGMRAHIEAYTQKAERLGIAERTHFLGTRPVALLRDYLMQADILASPRVRGNNTPMKIYSYLHSGRATLATALPTHTQVLTREVAMLVHPTVEGYAAGLCDLLADKELRQRIGWAAKELAEKRYTFDVFRRDLNSLYDRIGERLEREARIRLAA